MTEDITRSDGVKVNGKAPALTVAITPSVTVIVPVDAKVPDGSAPVETIPGPPVNTLTDVP